jgi:alpha-tubulin suppressor-like RCC1 family protein
VATLSNITAIATGAYHGLVLRADGRVFAWGQNSSGQLGDGSQTNSATPVQVGQPEECASLSR